MYNPKVIQSNPKVIQKPNIILNYYGNPFLGKNTNIGIVFSNEIQKCSFILFFHITNYFRGRFLPYWYFRIMDTKEYTKNGIKEWYFTGKIN